MLKDRIHSLATGAVIGGECQNSPNSCPFRRSLNEILKPQSSKPKGSRKRKPKTAVPQAAPPAPVAL